MARIYSGSRPEIDELSFYMGGDGCAAKWHPAKLERQRPALLCPIFGYRVVFTYLFGHEFPVFFPVIYQGILTAWKFQVAEASGHVFWL